MNHPPKRIVRQRIYVKVTAGFDSTGYMQPTSIIWSDGRIFPIELVKDYRPAEMVYRSASRTAASCGRCCDCYTVVIKGQDRHLFFEHTDPTFRTSVGRWYVEILC